MSYDKIVVKKPWGYEYLAYENDEVGLWFLHIKQNHQTSLHCHPKKTTGLIVLDGEADVSFIDNTFKLKPGRKIMIRKGLFHATKALSKEGAFIFEIETPKNKHDIIRLEDKYGRETEPYEGKNFEMPKKEDCIWFNNPLSNKIDHYDFANCKITVQNTNNIDDFHSKEDSEHIIFLKGGILHGDNKVAQPGDVIVAKTIKRLLKTFKNISNDTVIMTIKNSATSSEKQSLMS